MAVAEHNVLMSLVLVDVECCVECGGPTQTISWQQPPLFRHGGYGAVVETALRHCARFCGWWRVDRVDEISPRRRDDARRTLAE